MKATIANHSIIASAVALVLIVGLVAGLVYKRKRDQLVVRERREREREQHELALAEITNRPNTSTLIAHDAA